MKANLYFDVQPLVQPPFDQNIFFWLCTIVKKKFNRHKYTLN